jgi:uncharacterized protein (TIGR03086 family)
VCAEHRDDDPIMSEAARMLSLLRNVMPATSRVIARIAGDQWPGPTPCDEMTVHELASHLVGGVEQFGGVAAGLSVDVTATTEVEPVDVSARFDGAAERMLDGWSTRGAGEAIYPLPWGDTPGVMLIGFMVIEVATHGWDLARATGQNLALDDRTAQAVMRLAESYDDPSIRVPGMFAPIIAVPDDAPTIDRLAAFLGRDPKDWRA